MAYLTGLAFTLPCHILLHTGTVAQLVEHPLCDRVIAGSIRSRVIPKKMVLAALWLGAQNQESIARNPNWSSQCRYNVTGWNLKSSVLGVTFL